MNDLTAELDLLTAEVLAASGRYRHAKERFVAQQAILRRRYPNRGDFLVACRDNVALREAISDCAWYGADLERCAAALTALALARTGTGVTV